MVLASLPNKPIIALKVPFFAGSQDILLGVGDQWAITPDCYGPSIRVYQTA